MRLWLAACRFPSRFIRSPVPSKFRSEVFTTGDSVREPQPLPDVTVEYGGLEDSGGVGSCASLFYAGLTAKFAASQEPWLLWPTNPFDMPLFVGAGRTELTWDSIDPTECFILRQVNWAGQVSTTDVEVCVPPPSGPGFEDAGSGPRAVDAGPLAMKTSPADESGCSCRAPSSEPNGALAWVASLVLALGYRRRRSRR